MAEKTLSVRLTANVTAYKAAMRDALGTTQALTYNLKVMGDHGRNALADIGKASDEHLRDIGQNAMIAGAAVAVGLGIAVKSFMDFDSEMSNLAAVTGAGADEMDTLRDAALDAGAATVFSASEAARAQVELAKAGVSTSDILSGALRGALDLASAGNLDLARAAELAANGMTTFGLSGSDVPRIADALAAGANKSAAEVEDMGMSLSQAGLVAAQTGLSLEDTVGVLSMFAQAGMKGSDAGTSLKTMLMRLTPVSGEAADMMKSLGLEFFNAQGEFVGIEEAAGRLQAAMGPLTQEQRNLAMQTIFGSDAVRAATVLYSGGAEGVGTWVEKVTDAGYAAELAAIKTDNLKGDLEALKGSFETVLIESGSEANNMLRSLTQGLTDFVNGIGAMPGPAQQAAVGIAGITGAGLLAVGVAGSMIPRWREVNTALTGMGPAGARAATGIGMATRGLAVALPGVIFAATVWGDVQDSAKRAIAEFTKDWTVPQSYAQHAGQLQQLIDEYNRLQEIAKQGDGIMGGIADFGELVNPWDENDISNAEQATHEYKALIEGMMEGNNNWAESNKQLQGSLGLTQAEVDALASKAGIDLKGAVGDTVPAVQAFVAELAGAPPAVYGMNTSLSGLEDKTKSTEDKLGDLSDALERFLGIAFGEEASLDKIQSAMHDLGEAIKAVKGDPEAMADANDDLAEATTRLADARNRIATAADPESHARAVEDEASALDAVAEAQERLNEAQGSGSFADNSEAALEFRDLMRDMAGDAVDVITQLAEMGVQGDDLRTRVYLLSQSMIDQAVAMGVPRDEAEKYFGVLNNLPPEVFTTITTPGVVGAQTDVGNLNTQLETTAKGAEGSVTIDTTQAREALAHVLQMLVAYYRTGGNRPDLADAIEDALLNPPDPIAFRQRLIDTAEGRAAGGRLAPFSAYEITENAPETAVLGGRHYLFTGARSGHMYAASGGGDTGSSTSIGHQGDDVKIMVVASDPSAAGRKVNRVLRRRALERQSS